MGRKIPGRKHKGVKDPLVQNAVREEKLKNKINAPPCNPNEQEIPKSLENLIHLKQMVKDGKFNKQKRKRNRNKVIDTSKLMEKEVMLPGMKRRDKALPNLSQWYGETDEMFCKRVDEATQSVMNEIEFEQQFGVHVRNNADTGEEDIEMAEPDEIETFMKMKQLNEKNKFKKKKKNRETDDNNGNQISLNSKQRKKMKFLTKKEESMLDSDEKFNFRDNIKFGETVHAPPQLTVRPKNTSNVNRPGVKGNLLLQKMLNKNSDNNKSSKTSKNLNLTLLAKQKQEEERKNIVQMYRNIKAQRVNRLR